MIRDAGDVDFVIAFGVHLAEVVFVEKIVADGESPFIGCELDVVRSGARA